MGDMGDTVVRRGTVSKCPSCGAQLASFTSACTACGHELTDIAANRSIASMVERLDAVQDGADLAAMRPAERERAIVERRARVIRDFPIPHAREDLQQMLYFIQPRLLPSVKPDPNLEDWRAKFNEAIGRARFAYKDDSAALAAFAGMEQALSVSVGADLKIKAKRNPMLVLLLVGAALLGVGAVAQQQASRSKLADCEGGYTARAEQEKTRLDALAQSSTEHLKADRFLEARDGAEQLRWTVVAADCKAPEQQMAVKAWDERRTVLSTQIDRLKAEHQNRAAAAVQQAAAAEQAQAERVAVTEQAEALRLAEVQRKVRDAEQARASTAATVTRKVETDKVW